MGKTLSTSFIPTEDYGVLYVDVSARAGATLERTEKVLDAVQQVSKKIRSVESVSTLAGYSLVNDVPSSGSILLSSFCANIK